MTKLINSQCSNVTIGIPFYNEEKYIGEAIRSAAIQCGAVWISDNASTDDSAGVCESMSPEYPNVSYVRQHKNQGAVFNFKFVLDKATTPYFMWLGGHDILPHGYVQNLMKLYENNPEAVLVYGASQHIDVNGEFVSHYDYFYSSQIADESPSVRLLGLIRYLGDCSLIHGIFRTDDLRAAWDEYGSLVYRSADHVLLGHAALKGRFIYDPKTSLIRRDVHPVDTAVDQLKRMGVQTSNEEQLSHRMMQVKLYSQAINVSENSGLNGMMYRIRARFYLVMHFGPFGKTKTARKFEELIFLIQRFRRMAKGILHRVMALMR